MPILSYAAARLLAGTLIGGFYLILLFGLCFGGVVGVKLLNRRMREAKRRAESQQSGEAESRREETAETAAAAPKKKKSAPKTKNVYYIVEKKRSRPKAEYSEPKEIRFEK